MSHYIFLSVLHILSSQSKPWWQAALDSFGGFGNIVICGCTLSAAFVPEAIRRLTKREITYSVTLTSLPSSVPSVSQEIVEIEFSSTGNEDIEPGDHQYPMEIDLKGRTVTPSSPFEIIQTTGVIPTGVATSFFTSLANDKIQLGLFKLRTKEKFSIRFITSDTSGAGPITVNAWIKNHGRVVEQKKGLSRFWGEIFSLSFGFLTVIWLWHTVANWFLTDETFKELILSLCCTVYFITTTTWIYIRRAV